MHFLRPYGAYGIDENLQEVFQQFARPLLINHARISATKPSEAGEHTDILSFGSYSEKALEINLYRDR